MTTLIEIKETFSDKPIIQIDLPDGPIIHVDWDSTNAAINLRLNGKVFWLYTPNVVTVEDVVVPDITVRTIIKLLGYAHHPITITLGEPDCNIWDKLVYSLPRCSIVIHPIDYTLEYSYFASGFTPLFEMSH